MWRNGDTESALLGHGLAAYAEGCRCAVCKRAHHSAYMTAYAKARKEWDEEYAVQVRAVARKSDRKMRSDPERWVRKKAQHRLWAKEHARKRRRKLAQIKVARGCAICGYNEHPAALEFHHVDGSKLTNVSRMVSMSIKWSRVLEEIAKCELLCANCHRVVSVKMQQVTD